MKMTLFPFFPLAAMAAVVASCEEEVGTLPDNASGYVIQASLIAGEKRQTVMITHGRAGEVRVNEDVFWVDYSRNNSEFGKDTVLEFDGYHMVFDSVCVTTIYDPEFIVYTSKAPDVLNADFVTLADDVGNEWHYSPVCYSQGRVYDLTGADIVPGRTYTISVGIGGQTYSSTARMEQPPTNIEARFRPWHVKNDEYSWEPYVRFPDPDPTRMNYYLVMCGAHLETLEAMVRRGGVPATISSDVNNNSGFVDGLVIKSNFGSPSATVDPYGFLRFSSRHSFTVYTINKEAHDYFYALSKQMASDGGAFSTHPFTPASAFSQSPFVQGYFIAAAPYSIFIEMDDETLYDK